MEVLQHPRIDQYASKSPQVIEQAEKALGLSPARPRVFQRGNVLVTVAPAAPRPKEQVHCAPGVPQVRVISGPTLRNALAKAATWTVVKGGKEPLLVPAMPLPWVVDTLLEAGEWPHVAPLAGITTTPTFRPSGSILDKPGYDKATGLYYDPGETVFPPVPDAPTKADASDALERLEKPFADFPFKETHHKSAAMAALLTLLIRHTIPDNVPIFGVSAPTPGTGKSLLVNAIATVAIGRPAPNFSQPSTEEEWSKQLFACALEGYQAVLIDNCTRTIASKDLCRYTTAVQVEGRILGLTKNASAPQNAVYFATGNNLRWRSDIVRRVIPIEMFSELERPEDRTEFTTPRPLLPWLAAHRGELVRDALTILRAYHLAAEKPKVHETGSFESWCTTVCAPLVWLGKPNPLVGTEDVKVQDEDRDKLRTLLIAWHEVYQGESVLLSTVKDEVAFYALGAPYQEGGVQGGGGDEDAKARAHSERIVKLQTLGSALRVFDTTEAAPRTPTGSEDLKDLNMDSVAAHFRAYKNRPVCGKLLTTDGKRSKKGARWLVRTLSTSPCTCALCTQEREDEASDHVKREESRARAEEARQAARLSVQERMKMAEENERKVGEWDSLPYGAEGAGASGACDFGHSTTGALGHNDPSLPKPRVGMESLAPVAPEELEISRNHWPHTDYRHAADRDDSSTHKHPFPREPGDECDDDGLPLEP